MVAKGWGEVVMQVMVLQDDVQARLDRGESRRKIYLTLLAEQKIECSQSGFYSALEKIIPDAAVPVWKRLKTPKRPEMRVAVTKKNPAPRHPAPSTVSSTTFEVPCLSLEELAFGKSYESD